MPSSGSEAWLHQDMKLRARTDGFLHALETAISPAGLAWEMQRKSRFSRKTERAETVSTSA